MWVSTSGVTSAVSDVGGRTVDGVLSRSRPPIGWYGVDIAGPTGGRTVEGVLSRSRPPIGWYGVDIAGPIPVCRGGPRSNHLDAVKEGLVILPSDPDVRGT